MILEEKQSSSRLTLWERKRRLMISSSSFIKSGFGLWKIHLASLKHVANAAAVEGLMQSREMQVKSGLGLPKFAKSCHWGKRRGLQGRFWEHAARCYTVQSKYRNHSLHQANTTILALVPLRRVRELISMKRFVIFSGVTTTALRHVGDLLSPFFLFPTPTESIRLFSSR